MFQQKVLKLNNGLQIIWDHRPSYQSLAVCCIVKAGSKDDPADRHGLAHCVEHLILESSDDKGLSPISHEILESGGYINAVTGICSTDFSVYAYKEDALESLRILAKILSGRPADPDILKREKTIIGEEMRLSGPDHQHNINRVQFKLLGASESFQHAGIGNSRDLQRITIRDIQAFHKNLYTGSNIILVIAGNLDPELYQNEIVDIFSSIPNSSPAAEAENWTFRKGPRHQLLTRSPHCAFCFSFRLPFDDPKVLAALELLNNIFIESPHSALQKRLRQVESLCYSIGGGWWIINNAAILSISGSTNPNNLQKAVRCVLEEGALLASYTIAEEELEKLKSQSIKKFLLEMEAPGSAAAWYASHTFLGITNSVAEWMQLLGQVKPEQINQITRTLFSPENIYAYIYGSMHFWQAWQIKRLFRPKNIQEMLLRSSHC